jgi:hypothetical protein
MEFQQARFNSDEYRQSLILRESIPRRPLELGLSASEMRWLNCGADVAWKSEWELML